MNDSPGRAGMALVAAALYLLAWLFVAGVGYVLHLIAGYDERPDHGMDPRGCLARFNVGPDGSVTEATA